MSKEPTPKRVPFFPDLFFAEVAATVLVLAALFIATALGYSAPLEDLADPYLTPEHAAAPWYFLFLQGLLKVTPKIVGAFIVPVIIVGALFLLPFLDRKESTPKSGKVALIVVIVVFILWAVLTYMGTPAFGNY